MSRQDWATILHESLWEAGGCPESGAVREGPPKAVLAEDMNQRDTGGPGTS